MPQDTRQQDSQVGGAQIDRAVRKKTIEAESIYEIKDCIESIPGNTRLLKQ